MAEQFLNDRVSLFCGDCLSRLTEIEENSIDACVVDPPYHLTSIVKRFGKTSSEGASKIERDADTNATAFGRGARGFMGKVWDGGDIAFQKETWEAVSRVLKPGGHLVAFGAPKNSHRLTCAIEDAGFEIRDGIAWLFGSGFPKSHDVALDFETTLCDRIDDEWRYKSDGTKLEKGVWRHPSAVEWDGFGTALKPAIEPITLARKPLSEGTVAANVLRWRTGALNIDASRVEHITVSDGNLALNPHLRTSINGGNGGQVFPTELARRVVRPHSSGRWPANVAHDGSDEVVGAFPSTAGQLAPISTKPGTKTSNVYSKMNREGEASADRRYTDKGSTNFAAAPGQHREPVTSAARFFFSAKADALDRVGSKHPTVKPIDLMRWLVRLVTPPAGTVIDPFAGTGTTGEAAWLEGMNAILIERDPQYQDDIRRRMRLCLSGPDEKARESIKAKFSDKPANHGPLFGDNQ